MRRIPHPARGIIVNRGQTITEVAGDLGIKPDTLRQVLSGRVEPWPSLRQRMSEYLDRPETELFLQDSQAVAR